MDASIYKTRFRWSTQILNCIDFDTYYQVTVNAENINEPGSLIQIKIGFYIEDNLGNRFTISGVNIGGIVGVITATDDFKNGFGPRIGEGVVYESVDLGTAPFIGPTKYENLDQSALSRALGIDMDILWRNLYPYWRLSSETINYGFLYNWYSLNPRQFAPVIYGYLYNYYTLANIAAANAHVPSLAEWNALNTFLGGGENVGGMLKEVGYTHWNSPNLAATNSIGFNAFGNGERDTSGNSALLMVISTWWASDGLNIDCHKDFGTLIIGSGTIPQKSGIGVRLIVDTPIEISGTHAIYVGNDGRRYDCVLINSIWWTVQNLAETLYNDLTPIPEVTDNTAWAALSTGARCSYNNDESLAVNSPIVTSIAAYNAHVPSSAEWEALSVAYGGDTVSGGHLKEAGFTHWPSSNIADNSSGFSAFGAGYREVLGSYTGFGIYGIFWGNDSYSATNGYETLLQDDNTNLQVANDIKQIGNSVRLIVDSPNTINPDLETGTYIGNDNQVYNCRLMADGKWWLIESLIETQWSDGSQIPEIVDPTAWTALISGARCSYNNDPDLAYVAKLRVSAKNYVNFVDSTTIAWTKTQVSPTEIDLVASLISGQSLWDIKANSLSPISVNLGSTLQFLDTPSVAWTISSGTPNTIQAVGPISKVNTSSLFSTGLSGTWTMPATDSIFLGGYAGNGTGTTSQMVGVGKYAAYNTIGSNGLTALGGSAGSFATNVHHSLFAGFEAGFLSVGSFYAINLGYYTGVGATSPYSFLAGYNVGYYAVGYTTSIGANNIIIGTNISLDNGVANAIN